MEQLQRDMSEVIQLENLNTQRIERLSDAVSALKDTLRDSVSPLATGIATQAQALAGFRELYLREIAFIHQSVADVKHSIDGWSATILRDKEALAAVERDIAVTRGSIRGAVMSWSGFVALIAFGVDKAVEMWGKK